MKQSYLTGFKSIFVGVVLAMSCVACILTESNYQIGQRYENGDGVKQSSRKAFKWYKMGAEEGDLDAQYKVAEYYVNGTGTARDNAKAKEWYSKAASQGHVKAREALKLLEDQERRKKIVEEKAKAEVYAELRQKKTELRQREERKKITKRQKRMREIFIDPETKLKYTLVSSFINGEWRPGIDIKGFDEKQNVHDIKNLTIPTSLSFPDKSGTKHILPVVSVDSGVFARCANLESVTLPPNARIGAHAFFPCNNLTNITFKGDVNKKNKLGVIFLGTRLRSVVLEEGCRDICSDAFWRMENLESVSIPSSVTNIGNSAFASCKTLKRVVIPNGVKRINDQTFGGCESLEYVELPDSLETIGDSAFCNCAVKDLSFLTKNVKSIGVGAFANCSNLKAAHLPGSVKRIRDYTFRNCSNLETVNIHEGVTHVGYDVFANCPSLKSATIPSSIKVWESSLSRRLTNVVIRSDAVMKMGTEVFGETRWYKKWREGQPNGLLVLNGWIVGQNSCEGDIVLPNDIRGIAADAFWGSGRDCRIRSITIPNGVTNISVNAFKIRGVDKISVPSNLNDDIIDAIEDKTGARVEVRE